MQIEFDLPSGHSIVLRELRQRLTYESLVEGQITPAINQRIFGRILRGVDGWSDAKLTLLELPSMKEALLPSAHGLTRPLPKIVCAACFRSWKPLHDPLDHYSEAIIVWLQDEFALPFSDEAVAELGTLNWASIASDFSD